MSNYKKEKETQMNQKWQEIAASFPKFARDYLINRTTLSACSLLGYTQKLHSFFYYLTLFYEPCKGKKIKEITLEDISLLTYTDINAYTQWLGGEHIAPTTGQKIAGISKKSKENYLSCLSSFFNKLLITEQISKNPMLNVERAKVEIPETVIYLDKEEKEALLNTAEFGTGLSPHSQKLHKKSQFRDPAIIKLFLDTGCRVSELVGLDVEDVNMKNHSIRVIRKGKTESMQELFFSDVTQTYLQDYLAERESTFHPPDGERALFLSKNGTRMGIRSMEKMVKKYMIALKSDKSSIVSCHKLRSTYAMGLYGATGDIELVRSTLGHSSITTTSVYAKASKEREKEVRNILDES